MEPELYLEVVVQSRVAVLLPIRLLLELRLKLYWGCTPLKENHLEVVVDEQCDHLHIEQSSDWSCLGSMLLLELLQLATRPGSP